MSIFIALCRQHVLLAWRSGHTTLIVSFLFIAVLLMPFGLGPELALLRKLAPGLLWVVLLMSLLLCCYTTLFRTFWTTHEAPTKHTHTHTHSGGE